MTKSLLQALEILSALLGWMNLGCSRACLNLIPFWLVVTIIAVPTPTFCQKSQALQPSKYIRTSEYIRTRFGMEDGLPSNQVDEVVQTHDGLLWFREDGTDLSRFDGHRFDMSRKLGIATSLAVAPNGDLWVGTEFDLKQIREADLTRFGNWSFVAYSLCQGSDCRVNTLHFTRDGVLWVGTDHGLFQFAHGQPEEVIPALPVIRIEEGDNGHLWLITPGQAVEWDGRRVLQHPELPSKLGVKDIYQIFEDSHGVTWYCTGNGIARYARGRIEKLQPWGPSGHGTFRVYEDPKGSIWVAGAEGLARITSTGLELVAPGLNVRADGMYGDRDGDLWVGTNGDGVYRFKDPTARTYTTEDGLPSNVVMTVLATHDGSVWAGFNCGGISHFDNHRFRVYNEKDGLLNSCVWSLAEDARHDLWIGTWGGGVFRFHEGKFTQFSKPEGLSEEVVTSVVAARDGSLWLAGGGGVSRILDGRIKNFGKAEGLSVTDYYKVYEDRRGGIWIRSTEKGIERLVDDRFQPFFLPEKGRVNLMGEDRTGALYFNAYSSSGEPKIYRVANEQISQVDSRLEGNEPQIRETLSGDLWTFSSAGVIRFPHGSLDRVHHQDDPLDFETFGPSDGLPVTQPSNGDPVSAQTPDGKLWIGTNLGLVSLDLPHIRGTERKPTIYLEGVTVGRDQQTPSRELVLPAGTHHLELNFDAVEISGPEKIRLQYRMDGVDSEWLDAAPPGHAVYTTMTPGTYAFHIRACNRSGVWDRTGVVYHVTQEAYFYQTIWFRGLYVLAFFTLLWSVFQMRVHQLQEQEKKFSDAVETMPALAFVADPKGRRTFFNRGWLEYTGLNSEQASGSGWEVAIHPDDLQCLTERWRESQATGEPLDYEARLRRGSDGVYRWFQTRARPLRDNRGKIVKWCAVANDIEDRKRAEQLQADLTHASRVSTMGEMVASISHELAQPIQITSAHAKASSRWLQRDPPAVTEALKGTEKIIEAGALASEIISRLRSLYKKAPPKRELVAINEVVGEISGMMGGKAREHGVSIRTELKDDLPMTVADRVQLQQVLMNLMLNGIEAMKDTGGVLTLKSQLLEDGQIEISVNDTGPGLPLGKADQIFEAFFTTKPQGSGMGLSICRSIVESQGGRIWANGDGGRGATFHFTLPAAPAAKARLSTDAALIRNSTE
jgi:PAS domain S-box-containing protein